MPKPQAAKLKSSINNVRGDLLEKQFYESIKSYFETQNENVLVIHSHKLLGLKCNAQKEKDFIVVNLSFGYILNIEVKCSASGSNLSKALDQIKSTKEELENWFGLAGRWKFYGAIGCESHNPKGQSYEIKSPPRTFLWFRILGIFSVENIKRLCVFMFQTCSNSRRVL